jgi:hypothetical protein
VNILDRTSLLPYSSLYWALHRTVDYPSAASFLCSVADPGSGAFLLQGSGSESGMIFFRISDPYDIPNSIYLQDFTFKNGEKQAKLNFV